MVKKYNQIHIITTLSKGGAEKMLFKILRYGEVKTILVICLDKKNYYTKYIEKLNIKVVHLNLKDYFILNKIFVICKLFFYNSKSIVGWMYHGNLIATLLYLFNIIKFNKPKLTWNIRQTLYDKSREKKNTLIAININKLLSSVPNNIIFNSTLSIKQHHSFGFTNKNTVFIPNGFDLTHNYNKIKNLNLNIKQNQIIISHINRFHPMKNHKLALEIAENMLDKYKNITFIFCGSNVNLDNYNFKKLINISKDNLKRCFFLDDIVNVNEILEISNLFLLTSSWGDAFPNIIGEAMSNSCNIISTDVGDVRDIMGNTNITVPINSTDEFIKNIDKLIMTGQIYLKNKEAKKRIQKFYNIIDIVKKFNKVI